jgi:hypothetical protein
MYEHRTAPLLSAAQFAWRIARHVALFGALMSVSLVGGMAGYRYIARMSWTDAFLNASMLLGGMGPVGDLPTDAAKIFAGCYALYAGIVFIASAAIMIAPFAHRVLHHLHADDAD